MNGALRLLSRLGCVPAPAQQTRRENPDKSLPDMLRIALSQVHGAFGVCFLFADQPNLLMGARKGSPLILGIGKGTGPDGTGIVDECFLASDASAIIEYTNKVLVHASCVSS